MQDIGKTLVIFGLVLLVIGGVLLLGAKIPFLGKLPGDIYVKRDNFVLFFPITTMILLSVALSLIVNLFSRH
jgi:hypothetical protein